MELAASAGLYLDGWQQDVLKASLGERPDGQWAAFEVGLIVPRQSGKGSVLEARELAGLFLFGERMIVHTSHEFKTSLEAYRRLRALIESTPDLDRKVKQYWQTTGYEGIELKNGARLRFLARSKGSGRGFSGDLVILDEAFALTSEQLEALMPTLSARPNPQIWYTSSPPLDGLTGEPLYALRARGEEGTADGLAWFDWGAEAGVNPDDREAWYASNPALGIRITEEFVARERAAMTPDGFARERLGVWPRSAALSWAVIPEADWKDVLDDLGQPQDPVVFAIDTTPERSQSAIVVVGSRVDGDLHGELVDHRPGTGWVVARAVDLVKRWRPAALVVDPAGAGGAFIADLHTELCTGESPLLPEITLMKARGVAQAYGMFHLAVKKHPDAELVAAAEEWAGPAKEPAAVDEPVRVRKLRVRERQPLALTKALAGAATRRIGDGTTWDRRTTDVDISPLVALTNALHGFLTLPEPEPELPPPATASSVPEQRGAGFFRPTGRLKI